MNNAYPLALYIASPREYEEEFVENFPTDHEGLMSDIFVRVEAKGLTPRFMYSVRSLARIAEEGNEQAIEKVFQGCLHTGAAVTVAFSETAINVLVKQSEGSLRTLSLLTQKERRKIYSLTLEYIIISPEQSQSIRKQLEGLKRGATEKEQIVITEILEIPPPSGQSVDRSEEE